MKNLSFVILTSFLFLLVSCASVRTPVFKGPGKRDDWFMYQRGFDTKVTPLSFQKASKQARNLKTSSRSFRSKELAKKWSFLGPTNIGGRVVDLVVDPKDKDTIYVASATGGMWLSKDGGKNFSSIWKDSYAQSMGAVAIDPDGVLYAGTGEANPGGGSIVFGGSGVFKSTDRGLTWKNIGLENSRSIGRIKIDPKNKNIIYVAAMGPLFSPGGERGLYKSDNAGKTWKLILAGDNPTTGAVDLVIDPENSKKIYVAMWDRIRKPNHRMYGGVGSGVYRSVDGGKNFERLNVGLPAKETKMGRIGLALAKGASNELYAIVGKTSGHFEGMYHSSNAGESFKKLPGSETLKNSQSSFSWWFGRIFVHPTNKSHLFVSGVPLLESTNAGKSWIEHRPGHADQHIIAWDTNYKKMYIGNDGGVFSMEEGGDLSTDLKYPVSQPYTQFYNIAVSSQDSTRVSGGTQDNSSILSWGKNGWESYFYGDGLVNLINPKDQNIVYACMQYGTCVRSKDGGKNVEVISDDTGSDRRNWQTPIVFDPNNPEVMYYGGNILNRSTDGGSSWKAISPSLSEAVSNDNYPFGTITSIRVSKSNPELIYVGTDDGRLWKTQDLGENWDEIKSKALPRRWITNIEIDPKNENNVFVSYSGFRNGENRAHLLKSNDGGKTWFNLSGTLPETPINDFVFVNNSIVVATDVGVFVTKDEGKKWFGLGEDLPLVPVLSLEYHAGDKKLFSGTFGRGIYIYKF